MTHFVNWQLAAVEWTAKGYELSAPFPATASLRQVLEATAAVETAFARLRRDDITVTCTEPGDDGPGELLLTSPQLLALDPATIHRIVDPAADQSANVVAAADRHDGAQIARWIGQLRATP